MKRPTHQDLELLALESRHGDPALGVELGWEGSSCYTLVARDGVPVIQRETYVGARRTPSTRDFHLNDLELEVYQGFLTYRAA